VARSTKVQPKGPDWTPEQTLRVLREQLEKLQALRGKDHREVANTEEVWKQTTEAALTHGFGEGSTNVGHYHSARWAGTHNLMGISGYQQQLNYNQRIEKFEATLLSSIAELEASMPEVTLRGAYSAGDEYAFYQDLRDIMAQAKADIFILDNYLNTEFFDLYVATVKAGVNLRIMTDHLRGNLGAVAQKYANSYPVELRSSPDLHDRHIFVDDRCWAVGQSIKDAARKKPTYMVELSSALVSTMRQIYEDTWSKATVVIKS
jgi:hypothetical protein